MKLILRSCLLAAMIFCYSTTQAQVKKILFIGNSLTYFNDMPQTVKDIGMALGDSLDVTVYAPGGTGFINHVADPAVYQYFRQGDWDYIVLQPGSNESPGFSAPVDTTIARGKILVDSIRLYNPCVQVFLYEISYGVSAASAQANTNYYYAQSLIKANLARIADSMHCALVPAGETMRNIWSRDTSFLIWNSYGDIHPNAYGSYAIASTFAATIFKKSVAGIHYFNNLDSNKCRSYQHIADSIVFTTPVQWRLGQYGPYARFSFNINGNTVSFQQQCLHYDQLIWDLGDGTSSSQSGPVKSYAQPGTYHVQLKAYWQGCYDMYDTTIILISPNNIPSVETGRSYHLYPNPARDKIYIDAPETEELQIVLYNALGQCVLTTPLHAAGVDISATAPGFYWYRIISAGSTTGGRVLIRH